jgi:glycosyltransferase involved in cell wall biosynthesis
MNIIVTTPTWSLNGVNIFSANLVRGLQQRGLPARLLITDSFRPDHKPLPLPHDLTLEQLPIKGLANWSSRWRSLVQYLEALAPCIYLPNYDYRYSCISSALSSKVGIVGIAHSDDPQYYNHISRLGRYWNSVVAVSPAIAGRIVQHQPELATRLVTIPYGVEVSSDQPRRHDKLPLRLLYVGRLEQRQKRVLDLIQIADLLKQRGLHFELTIIGSGPAQKLLEQNITAGRLTDCVKLLKTLSHEKLRDLYAQHDIFLLTSAFEGLPLGLLEAMSQGCVPVVSDVESGVRDVIEDGQNGFRVTIGAIDLFAERILTLAHHPDLRHKLSANAMQTIKQNGYRLDDMLLRYIDVFEAVFEEIQQGTFVRPYAPIIPPPMLTFKDRLLAPIWPFTRRWQSKRTS